MARISNLLCGDDCACASYSLLFLFAQVITFYAGIVMFHTMYGNAHATIIVISSDAISFVHICESVCIYIGEHCQVAARRLLTVETQTFIGVSISEEHQHNSHDRHTPIIVFTFIHPLLHLQFDSAAVPAPDRNKIVVPVPPTKRNGWMRAPASATPATFPYCHAVAADIPVVCVTQECGTISSTTTC